MILTPQQAALELLARRKARRELHAYIEYTTPKYKATWFSRTVCKEIDQFIVDMRAGKRPILILQAPPQHGKTEIVSRKLPPFLLGCFPDMRIMAASYANGLAGTISREVRRNMKSQEHLALWPTPKASRPYTVNKAGEFDSPYGDGSYMADGVGGAFTGKPSDVFIIDDPIKNHEEALSQVTKEGLWNWYQSTSSTRMSENSGQIVMATSWAEDDLAGRIIEQHRGKDRVKHLAFPAINRSGETGYNPAFPEGPLVPDLHSLTQLEEIKEGSSDYWWSCMYQQSPKPIGGNVFKEHGIQYYTQVPTYFERIVMSWDCTFKDTDGTDYVVGQAWGVVGSRAYLLHQVRARMSFSETVAQVVGLYNKFPSCSTILIEDKANGPAVIDVLKTKVPGILPVNPEISKLARAHGVTSYWEAHNVFLPHPDIATFPIRDYTNEITRFPAGANDDQVDATTQALRYIFGSFGTIAITDEALALAMGR